MNVEILLDIILQILNVLEALERIFGFDLSDWFGGS